MSRYTRLIQIVCSLCLISLYAVGRSFADDVPLPLKDFLQKPEVLGYGRVEILVMNFCATVVIEYLVICAFLGWPERAVLRLISWVFIVNVITNPAAQASAIFFGRVMESEASAWQMVGLVELAVTAVEFVLVRCILGRMYRQGALDRPITARRTLLMVAVSNAASFAFGFVGLISVLIDLGP